MTSRAKALIAADRIEQSMKVEEAAHSRFQSGTSKRGGRRMPLRGLRHTQNG